MKVWVTGAGGLIGSYLVRVAAECVPAWEIRSLTRQELDLTDSRAVVEFFENDKPDWIIHCAGLTKSPACEENPELAFKLNVEATRTLCELAFREGKTRVVFFSTDLVFDGRKGNYAEDDPTAPLSVYGKTKVAAEKIVLENPENLVIRTSLNAGVSPTGDRSFTEQLKRAVVEGRMLKLFVDEYRAPIHASVTARAVWELILAGASGIFHVAGTERLSRWEIGMLLAKRWPALESKIVKASARDYPGPPRPADTSLNCRKAQSILSFPLPRFSEWLELHPDAEL